MKDLLDKAQNLVEENFLEESMNNMRKFMEASVIELGERHNCLEKKSNHWIHMTIQEFRVQELISKRIIYYLENLQKYGNYASHFQDDGIDISTEDANHCIYQGNEIFDFLYQSDNINNQDDFLKNAFEAVDCEKCGSKKGERCRPLLEYNSHEWEGEHEKNHQVRVSAYRKYRREIQKNYNITLPNAMLKMVNELDMQKGDIISTNEILNWFSNRYPAYAEKSITDCAIVMTTNLKTRKSRKLRNIDGKYDLFFETKKKFRLYDIEKDPMPLPFDS